MKVRFYGDNEIDKSKKSIFLAGPTLRGEIARTWRDEAVEILAKLGFDGEVYAPESKSQVVEDDILTYNGVIDWELTRQDHANIIFFWVPRDLVKLPAFTTNVEFGYRLKSGKVVYARPDTAPKTKYLDALYEMEYGIKPFSTLEEALKYCVNNLKDEINF